MCVWTIWFESRRFLLWGLSDASGAGWRITFWVMIIHTLLFIYISWDDPKIPIFAFALLESLANLGYLIGKLSAPGKRSSWSCTFNFYSVSLEFLTDAGHSQILIKTTGLEKTKFNSPKFMTTDLAVIQWPHSPATFPLLPFNVLWIFN